MSRREDSRLGILILKKRLLCASAPMLGRIALIVLHTHPPPSPIPMPSCSSLKKGTSSRCVWLSDPDYEPRLPTMAASCFLFFFLEFYVSEAYSPKVSEFLYSNIVALPANQ